MLHNVTQCSEIQQSTFTFFNCSICKKDNINKFIKSPMNKKANYKQETQLVFSRLKIFKITQLISHIVDANALIAD